MSKPTPAELHPPAPPIAAAQYHSAIVTTSSSLHTDLVELLRATRSAERDLYALLPPDDRDAPAAIGEWSAKDVLAHIAAWRAIEARRLEARVGKPATPTDPSLDDPIDEANAHLHADHAAWSWERVDAEADASTEDLISAFGHNSTDVLCECPDGIVAGNGANAANHSMGHLSDIARMADGLDRYGAFADEVERILARGHLPPRDSGVMLYNIGCHRALSGELDEARRVLRGAFAHRHDLIDAAVDDVDLVALNAELMELAALR
jgi:hypothetical protein